MTVSFKLATWLLYAKQRLVLITTLLKIFKRVTVISNKQYYNIYLVQRPVNMTTTAREFPILLQNFEKRSKFMSTKIALELMP